MIETERLMIRPFIDDDIDIILCLYSNEKIMQYMPNDTMDMKKSSEHLDRIICDWKAKPQVNFEMAVILTDSHSKIGRARIHLDIETDTAMIGWLLLENEWGKGYATEITKALIKYCFDKLHVHRICALCHPKNIGSWKTLEKCNMHREAYYRQKCKYIKKGLITWEDEVEYTILKEDYYL